MEVVKLSDLRKVYDEKGMPVEALSRVNLSIEKGEFLALVGPSGSGKTTLLNLIGGLDRPTAIIGTLLKTGEFAFAKEGRDFSRLVLSWDYNFPDTLYLLLEYLYNGGNLGRDASPLNITAYSGEIVTRNRNFLASGIGYDLTPLARFNLYDIYDIDAGSLFFNPEIRYNILRDLDWVAGAQIFSGDEGSEYGPFPDTYYTSMEWYF